MAKIDSEGKVGLIHQHQLPEVDTEKKVAPDFPLHFRVDWLSTDRNTLVGNIIKDCEKFGCEDGVEDETCICPTSVSQTAAFQQYSEMKSADTVLKTARVGAVPQDKNFSPVNDLPWLYQHPSGALTEDTLFKVTDSNGRTHYRRNIISKVELGNGDSSFRNPVSFFSPTDPSETEAGYEIDATLEHALYHPNTPSFVVIRLAQRFGVSNPSPRYVKNVAAAFRSGTHSQTGFGSGKYGCLKATIAALLLDKEVLDPILDADPMQ
jgi:hypothetical protein